MEGRKEHGEPVAASARQLEAQLQPGAVTSTSQRAVAVLHGKASRFASDNGAATASSSLPFPHESLRPPGDRESSWRDALSDATACLDCMNHRTIIVQDPKGDLYVDSHRVTNYTTCFYETINTTS